MNSISNKDIRPALERYRRNTGRWIHNTFPLCQFLVAILSGNYDCDTPIIHYVCGTVSCVLNGVQWEGVDGIIVLRRLGRR